MITFEEKIPDIDVLLLKNRGRWHLSNLGGFGYEDVSQIIRVHIYNKWHLWDQTRPFDHWCNKVIIHQIKNIVRNRYQKDAPPCAGCPFDRGGESCGYTPSGIKCTECLAFKKWTKKKQDKHFLNNTSSIDAETFVETKGYTDHHTSIKLEDSVLNFHNFICQFLDEKMIQLYNLIYVECLKDKEIIKILKDIDGKGVTRRHLSTVRGELREIAKRKVSDFDPEHRY